MRKSQLRQQVDFYCRNDHRGSYRARQHRYFVLHKMVRDLFQIGHVPPKWHAVTHEHILHLVRHWQKDGIKSSTVMKYMTIIRDFFKNIEHTISHIDNQSLGIKNPNRPQILINLPEDISNKLSNPIAKLLLELQVYFGLTLSEAMRLCPNIHIQENTLWITRDIATNSHDRMIPIRNDKQLETLKLFQMTSKEQSLILTYGYHPVRYAYNKELKAIGLPSSRSYRCFYAKNRYLELKKVLSSYLIKQSIMQEMGLQSRRTLWSYLNE
ncbi:MAG: hypothetical protein H0U75_12060 [Legionella sp.]|nr:hypothetical protein [Legionella sp.]